MTVLDVRPERDSARIDPRTGATRPAVLLGVCIAVGAILGSVSFWSPPSGPQETPGAPDAGPGGPRGTSFLGSGEEGTEPPADPPSDHLHGKGPTRRLERDGVIYLPLAELAAIEYDQAAAEGSGKPGLDGVPESVRALEGKIVVCRGYMLPITLVGDLEVTAFYVTDSALVCCFGAPFRVQDVVEVNTSPEKPARYEYADPVEIRGTFHVAPRMKHGFLESIFQMDLDTIRVLEPGDVQLRW